MTLSEDVIKTLALTNLTRFAESLADSIFKDTYVPAHIFAQFLKSPLELTLLSRQTYMHALVDGILRGFTIAYESLTIWANIDDPFALMGLAQIYIRSNPLVLINQDKAYEHLARIFTLDLSAEELQALDKFHNERNKQHSPRIVAAALFTTAIGNNNPSACYHWARLIEAGKITNAEKPADEYYQLARDGGYPVEKLPERFQPTPAQTPEEEAAEVVSENVDTSPPRASSPQPNFNDTQWHEQFCQAYHQKDNETLTTLYKELLPFVEQDDLLARYYQACMLKEGLGVDQDVKQAQAILEALLSANSMGHLTDEARFNLAQLLIGPTLQPTDGAAVVTQLDGITNKQNHPMTYRFLALAYSTPWSGITQSWTQAKHYIDLAVEHLVSQVDATRKTDLLQLQHFINHNRHIELCCTLYATLAPTPLVTPGDPEYHFAILQAIEAIRQQQHTIEECLQGLASNGERSAQAIIDFFKPSKESLKPQAPTPTTEPNGESPPTRTYAQALMNRK